MSELPALARCAGIADFAGNGYGVITCTERVRGKYGAGAGRVWFGSTESITAIS